jgi:ATP-dependent Lhr-like helicase
LVWDRERDLLSPRRGSRLIAIVSGGTIPDRGTYPVTLGEGGPRVGELDEEMVHETLPGQTFALGATTWRVERITRDRVIVSPAPGESGKLPFWRGDGPGRPIELGRDIGAFTRELGELDDAAGRARLRAAGLDVLAATNLMALIAEQRATTGTLPTDRAITVERFRDEIGDWRICILTPFGARVHAPWAIALEGRLQAETGMPVQTMWSDDGIALRFADADELPEPDALLLDPEQVDERLVERLGATSLFASAFRENAARALLLPRRRPGERTPLWLQRLRSQQLLSVAREYPAFPMIVETYRTCLRDVFDLPALRSLMADARSGAVTVDAVETSGPSPMARSLMFDYVAAYLYEGDLPVAERRAQALALDRQMLRELLGDEELRDLLDPQAVAEVAAELQALDPERRARDADDVHDLLRRLGDLTGAELTARTASDPAPLLATLVDQGRAAALGDRWIAADDAPLYADPAAIDQLLLRYARTHPPFTAADASARFGRDVSTTLDAMLSRGELVRGAPGEYCHPDVLRRIKRRSLARLRSEVAPVDAPALGRFLVAWHGVDRVQRGRARLEETIAKIEGLPLPYSDLERAILPARIPDFDPRELDELGAQGWLVWVGHGALGQRDGRIALYRRSHVASWLAPPDPEQSFAPLESALLAHLERAGASFLVELEAAAPGASRPEIEEALWNLVWAGQITNDTLQPLRALARRGAKAPSGRARGRVITTPGRWSLVRQLSTLTPSPPERAHRLALALLDRHGLISREVAATESLPDGYPPVHAVLRAMEDGGKVRRGYFVDGLGGMQFAHPAALEQLRAASTAHPERSLRATRGGEVEGRDALILAASDPASPWGAALPWPGRPDEGATGARRTSGALVVIHMGEPVLWLDKGGRRAVTFPAASDPDAIAAASRALAARRNGRFLRIETIDGTPANTSPLSPSLRAAGFYPDLRGLVSE